MNLSLAAETRNTRAEKTSMPGSDDVVELGLLLSAKRAEELIALARRRGSSVAQLLRGLIDNALAAESFN